MMNDSIMQMIDSSRIMLKHEATVNKTYFQFPNKIIFEGIIISDNRLSNSQQLTVIEKIIAKLSIYEYLKSGHLKITGMSIINQEIDAKRAPPALISLLTNLRYLVNDKPSSNFNLNVAQTKIKLTDENNYKEFITADFKLTIKNGNISSSGKIQKENQSKDLQDGRVVTKEIKWEPTIFEASANRKNNTLFIEKLNLTDEQFIVKMWGQMENRQLTLNGYSLINAPVGKDQSDIKQNRIINSDGYILDVDTKLNFVKNKVEIEHLKFNFNKNPILLKGDLLLSDTPVLNLAVSTDVKNTNNPQLKRIKHSELVLYSKLLSNSIINSGDLKVQFQHSDKSSYQANDLNINFNELSINFNLYPIINLNLKNLMASLGVNSDKYYVHINDIYANYRKSNHSEYNIEFDSTFYDGSIDGNVYIDTSINPTEISSSVNIQDVNVNQMMEKILPEAQFTGTFNSNINYLSIPKPAVKGTVKLIDGSVSHLSQIDAFTKYFEIASMQQLSFNKLVTNFSITPNLINFERFDFDSPDIDLSGNFDVNQQQFVKSNLSLSLSRYIIHESKSLRPLLSKINEEFDPIEFDFQLSGQLDALNFHWKPSEVKEILEQKLPIFIQRKIEKGIADSIEEPSAKLLKP